jgi:arginine/ornithine transport system permease protein
MNPEPPRTLRKPPCSIPGRKPSNAWASRSVWCFTYVIRGTPMLVQLFLIYYGLAQFPAVRESLLWPWL